MAKVVNISAEVRNSATKLIRQFGDFVILAEAIDRVGNIQQTVAEAESRLTGLAKKEVVAKQELEVVEGKVKKAKVAIGYAEKVKEEAAKETSTLESRGKKLESAQASDRNVHTANMEVLKKDEAAARVSIANAIEDAKVIIAKANRMKDEAAVEKAEALAMTRAASHSKDELETLGKKIQLEKDNLKVELGKIAGKFS